MRIHLDGRRLLALCLKETRQIVRDPGSGLIAFVLPVVLLIIFGYGLSLDARHLRVGVLNEDAGAESAAFVSRLTGSPWFEVVPAFTREELDAKLQSGEVRGYVALPPDFSAQLARGEGGAPVHLVTDGAEPNTANFVSGYVTAAWREWWRERAAGKGLASPLPVEVQVRHWYNPSAESRHYLIPGSMVIIMTVIGALLTSLVVAREWERGTMEALLASPVSRTEILLSKLLPYYVLGMLSMGLVVTSAVLLMGVPFRGSPGVLFVVTTVFLLSVMGLGLLISTKLRDQFESAEVALNVAFLPATLLSGAFFEVSAMPEALRWFTYLLPPRYFVEALRTLFLSGDVWSVLLPDIAVLTGMSALFLTLVARATPRRLDG